jgi:metal-sulfur cluster biosynthetic enzyme
MSSDPTTEEPVADEPTTDGATPCAHTEYDEGDEMAAYPDTGEGATGLEADVWAVLSDVDDPEMPISIVDLGLIYGVEVAEEGEAVAADGAHVTVEMTLTYTGCPARKYLTEEIEERVAAVDGVESVHLDLVWSPPWTVEMVTEVGAEQLREFGLSI